MPNIIKVKDLKQQELEVYSRLKEAELLHYFEPHGGLFIAESPNVVIRALDAGYRPMSLLLEEKEVEKWQEDILSRCKDIPIYVGEEEILKEMTGFALTRGMLCAMHRKPYQPMGEICKSARRVAVLEDVVNPTNVGAIIRSAAALHIDAVLLTAKSADPLYRRAIRVSMGTVFQIPVTVLPKDANWQCQIKELGFKTVAMALWDDSLSIDDKGLAKEEKLAIVLGTEGEGLNCETIERCDYRVKIPMAHQVDSLNVAAASAVAFWELTK